jgi:hypothetical protein
LTSGVVSHRSSSNVRNLTMFTQRIPVIGFSARRKTL